MRKVKRPPLERPPLEDPKPDQVRKCPQCGSLVTSRMVRCLQCGVRLQDR